MSKENDKRYHKPTLTVVLLMPGENVLSICNQGTGTGQYPSEICSTGNSSSCQDSA
jgi:hypothetical protein